MDRPWVDALTVGRILQVSSYPNLVPLSSRALQYIRRALRALRAPGRMDLVPRYLPVTYAKDIITPLPASAALPGEA